MATAREWEPPPDWLRDMQKDAEGKLPPRPPSDFPERNDQAAEDDRAEEAATSLGSFPEGAWRGVFADYRAVMRGSTEASDVAHFSALWALIATALGRTVEMFSGNTVYPNAYIAFYGESGDKKTTAHRLALSSNLLPCEELGVRVVRNIGTTEGIAEALRDVGANVYLMYREEFSALLSRGRWSGSTLFEFLTGIFDCPPDYPLSYRKDKNNPLVLDKPTPSTPPRPSMPTTMPSICAGSAIPPRCSTGSSKYSANIA